MNDYNLEDIALSYWRLKRWIDRAPVKEKKPALYALNRIEKWLNRAGLKILDLKGQSFDPGMPVEIIENEEVSEDNTDLIITKMLEPILIMNGELLHYGKVSVGSEVEVHKEVEKMEKFSAEKKLERQRVYRGGWPNRRRFWKKAR